MAVNNIIIDGVYISEIYRWYTEHALIVNRRYQRKLVWTLDEKQQFINTILHGYPVPLFLLVSSGREKLGTIGDKEIIDGLQRLEAIISFILNKYSVKIDGIDYYFNLSVYPGNELLIKKDELHQQKPVMPAEMCHAFLLYQLPVSIIDADEAAVDDVFKRINSTCRKLSSQDLRQAGVTSKFSDLVRIISTHLRGDASEDIVRMNDISIYSLSSHGLNYGVNIKDVFWVKQGIISEDTLRRSKDEEIVAILCSAILSNYTSGMSVKTLNMLYDTERRTYKNNEKLLTQSRFDDIISLFSKIVSDLEKVFAISDTTFSQLLFSNEYNYNKDLVFIVLFLALAQLYSENYYIEYFLEIHNLLSGIADREFSEVINTSECKWNTDIRNHLVERLKNVLRGHMVFIERDPEWNTGFINYLKQVTAEKQMFDFKIGMHDLRTGQKNSNVISKCVMTLTAMANTMPYKEGVIIFGISDKGSDAADYRNFYRTEVPKYNDLYISGVTDEAITFYGSIQNYTRRIKECIEKQNVNPEVKQYILTHMDTMKYGDQTLIILKLKTDKPLFYDDKMYVRYESHNHLVKNGSTEFYEVLSNFKENITVTQTVNRKSIKKLDAF